MNKGFTIVEILVVIAITAIVGTILVVIFSNTLRGSNKAQILAVIKQNGQSVLENMDKNIRNSDNVICPVPDIPSKTLVIVKNGCYTRYRFVEPSPNPNPTQNGQIQQDNPQPDPSATPCVQNSPAPTPNPGGISGFITTVCSDADLLVAPIVLTDTNSQLGVSVTGGSFTRSKQAGYRDNLTMFFILNPGVGIPSSITSQIDPIPFQTTIELR